MVTPDETGWRVGGKPHWLWAYATPETTVYAICPGRGFADAATVLGTDYAGVLVRDGWQVYRCYKGPLHQSCLSRGDDQAPALLSFGAEPPPRGVFGGGDVITVRLTWNEGVTVTGSPRLALRIGANTRFATFEERWGTTSLIFHYVVDELDRDDDGLSIAADAVDLNGGTIRDNGGNDADVDLGYRAIDNDPNYKVNGRLTPVPVLPAGAVLALLVALLGGGWRRVVRRPEC